MWFPFSIFSRNIWRSFGKFKYIFARRSIADSLRDETNDVKNIKLKCPTKLYHHKTHIICTKYNKNDLKKALPKKHKPAASTQHMKMWSKATDENRNKSESVSVVCVIKLLLAMCIFGVDQFLFLLFFSLCLLESALF